MNHYETLGVERSATPAEIKQAFRRKSSAAHPDREGGSVKAQQAVNAAWEVLGDAERRAHYDATGQSEEPTSIEAAARSMLLQTFSQVIDAEEADGNVLRLVGKQLEHKRFEEAGKQTNLRGHRERLAKQAGKIKVKDGDNLAQMVIDQKLALVDQLLPQIERGLLIIAAAAEMLRTYEEDATESESRAPAFDLVGHFRPTSGFFTR